MTRGIRGVRGLEEGESCLKSNTQEMAILNQFSSLDAFDCLLIFFGQNGPGTLVYLFIYLFNYLFIYSYDMICMPYRKSCGGVTANPIENRTLQACNLLYLKHTGNDLLHGLG